MKDAAYYRAYRARRSAIGRPCPSGPSGRPKPGTHAHRERPSKPDFLRRPLIVWDGEGLTTQEQTGLNQRAWRSLVDSHAHAELLGASHLYETIVAAIAENGGIVPAMENGRGGVRVTEEWRTARLERFFRRPLPTRETYGNADEIAMTVEAMTGRTWSSEDVRQYLCDYERLTLKEARSRVERQYAHLRPYPGRHIYIMLRSSGGSIEHPGGLSTRACLDHLLAVGRQYPGHVHVGFALSYDCEMILGSLSMQQMAALRVAQRSERIAIDGKTYAITYRPRKFLRVSDGTTTITLWDAFGFFQTSFVKACREWLSPEQLAEIGIESIAAMKGARATFSLEDFDEIRSYCDRELLGLRYLIDAVRLAHLDAAVAITRLDGAGATAGAILKEAGVKAAIAADPPEYRDAIARAYAGGRIEVTQIGYVGEVIDDDVRSAYPWGLAQVPTLAGATFHTDDISPYYLANLEWSFPKGLPWYPLFYRTPGRAIRFPRAGRGWFWWPEVEAAMAFQEAFGGNVIAHRHIAIIPVTDEKPFAFVHGMYALRNEWKRQGRAAQRVIKLGLNSLYGKTSQQLGARFTREKVDGRWQSRFVTPPYFSLAWAGMVTSFTRAKLVRAAIPIAGDVIMFATDGLFSKRAGATKLGEGLGEWERSELRDFVVAQPGVYWWRDDASENGWGVRCRGFNLETLLTPERVIDAWRSGTGSLTVPTTRFVTSGTAIVSEEAWKRWRCWVTDDRVLDITGDSEKRYGATAVRRAATRAIALESRSAPEWELARLESAPHDVAFWKGERYGLIGSADQYDDETEME